MSQSMEEDSFSDQIAQFQRVNSKQYSWSDDELKCLDEIQEYHAKMLEVIAQAKMSGPQNLPKPPKRKVGDLFREMMGKKKAKKQRSPAELHDYLQKNLVDVSKKIDRNFFIELNPNLAQMEEQLITGYKQIQKQNAQSLLFFLQYGRMLNFCFAIFETEKRQGKHERNWGEFLTQKIGISESYARKLRSLALDIDPHKFPQFLRLGLSFSEIMFLKKDIIQMLNEERFREFWQTQILLPTIQQESQEANS